MPRNTRDQNPIALALEPEGVVLIQLAALLRSDVLPTVDTLEVLNAVLEKLTWCKAELEKSRYPVKDG